MVNPRQGRAIRNGVVAAVATAVVLFVLNAVIPGRETEVRTSPTPSPSPTPASCEPGWTQVASPNPDPVGNQLLGVTALAPDDAWAVGGSGDLAEPTSTLIEHWDGSAWNIEESPDDGQTVNVLSAVDAAAPDSVWAVGRASDGFGDRPLIEHWDGFTWSLAEVPQVATTARLHGVAVVAANDAWAVGSVGDVAEGFERALFLHWDGSSWSPVDMIGLVGGGRSQLAAISSGSAVDVWAVGYHHNLPLALHFDGEEWSRVDVPGRGPLTAVAALPTGEAWAVGSSILYTDGMAWTASGRVRRGGVLAGVAALASSDVWAVGGTIDELGAPVRAIVQRFGGESWEPVIGEPIRGLEALAAAAPAPDGAVWLVGYRNTARRRATLVLRGASCAGP